MTDPTPDPIACATKTHVPAWQEVHVAYCPACGHYAGTHWPNPCAECQTEVLRRDLADLRADLDVVKAVLRRTLR